MKKSVISKLFALGAIAIMIGACDKEDVTDGSQNVPSSASSLCPDAVHGIVSQSLVDGPCWLVTLDNGDVFQPTNWDDFSLVPSMGLDMMFEYHEVNVPTICMVAPTIEFDCISGDSVIVTPPIGPSPCVGAVPGVILNYSLDGCGWVISLGNGDILEPVNVDWSAFNIVPQHGLNIMFTYHEVSYATICMVGITVEIDCAEVSPS